MLARLALCGGVAVVFSFGENRQLRRARGATQSLFNECIKTAWMFKASEGASPGPRHLPQGCHL